VAQGTGEPGQVLGVCVTLTSYPTEHENDVVQALKEIAAEPLALSQEVLPLLVLATPSAEKAEWAYDLLEDAHGTVSITRTWMDRDAGTARTACPSCGSDHTEPFIHAGPAARVNRKCTACGHLFKVKGARA
jgi:hypothetical protein